MAAKNFVITCGKFVILQNEHLSSIRILFEADLGDNRAIVVGSKFDDITKTIVMSKRSDHVSRFLILGVN